MNCRVITGANMWKLLVCFMVVLPAVLALNFSKCSKLPPPDLIRTSYCKSLPCKLIRGQEIKADISFENCETFSIIKAISNLLLQSNFQCHHQQQNSLQK